MRVTPGSLGKGADAVLAEGGAAGAEIDERAAVIRADGGVQHVGAHDHAGAAAEGCVVDGAVAVGGGGADVAHVQRPGAAVQGAAGEGVGERAGQHVREEGEDGGAPGHWGGSGRDSGRTSSSSGRTMVTRPARRST